MRAFVTAAIFSLILAGFCSPLAAQNNPMPYVNKSRCSRGDSAAWARIHAHRERRWVRQRGCGEVERQSSRNDIRQWYTT